MVVARVRYLVYLSSVAPQRIGLTLVAKTLRQKKRGCFNRRVTDWATAEFLLLKKRSWRKAMVMDSRDGHSIFISQSYASFHTRFPHKDNLFIPLLSKNILSISYKWLQHLENFCHFAFHDHHQKLHTFLLI